MSDRPLDRRASRSSPAAGVGSVARSRSVSPAAGASVAIVSRTESEIESVRAEIDTSGTLAHSFVADVSDERAVLDLLSDVREAFGPIEILVNNAAVVWPIGASRSIDVAQWSSALNVNVTAIARLSFSCLPEMLERGWGRIVNISSGIAERPGGMVGQTPTRPRRPPSKRTR